MWNQAYRQEKSYPEMFEAQLWEWDLRLDLVKAKAENLNADAKLEFDRQLAALQRKRNEALAEFEDLHTRGDVAWNEVKESTERVWSEWVEAMESFASRFR